MTVYASDSFDRGSDGDAIGSADVGGAWGSSASSGVWRTNNSFNYGYCSSPSDSVHNRAFLAIPHNDVDVSVSVFTSGTPNRIFAGLYLRDNGSDGWLNLVLVKTATTDALYLQQIVGFSVVASDFVPSFGITGSTSYTLRAVFSGSSVSAYVNGVLKLGPIAVDAALTSQNYGIGVLAASTADDGNSIFQSFLVTDSAPAFTGYLRPQQSVYRM